jgi:hypothetical protein
MVSDGSRPPRAPLGGPPTVRLPRGRSRIARDAVWNRRLYVSTGRVEGLEARKLLSAFVPSTQPGQASASSPVGFESPLAAAATVYQPLTSSELTAALNSAQLGDTIILKAGTTYSGSFTLPNKASGSGYITIQSSALTSLPQTGTRVGLADAANMPKIVASPGGAAVRTAPGAHHFKFVGVDVKAPADNSFIYNLILLGDSGPNQDTMAEVPHDLVFDRCVIRANSTTQGVRRGIALNSASTDVLNSYLWGFKEVGADSQAIAGWNGPGPFNIINNYLEGAGENVIFGGADPSIPNLVPSDIVVRRNHFFKPLSWKIGDPELRRHPLDRQEPLRAQERPAGDGRRQHSGTQLGPRAGRVRRAPHAAQPERHGPVERGSGREHHEQRHSPHVVRFQQSGLRCPVHQPADQARPDREQPDVRHRRADVSVGQVDPDHLGRQARVAVVGLAALALADAGDVLPRRVGAEVSRAADDLAGLDELGRPGHHADGHGSSRRVGIERPLCVVLPDPVGVHVLHVGRGRGTKRHRPPGEPAVAEDAVADVPHRPPEVRPLEVAAQGDRHDPPLYPNHGGAVRHRSASCSASGRDARRSVAPRARDLTHQLCPELLVVPCDPTSFTSVLLVRNAAIQGADTVLIGTSRQGALYHLIKGHFQRRLEPFLPPDVQVKVLVPASVISARRMKTSAGGGGGGNLRRGSRARLRGDGGDVGPALRAPPARVGGQVVAARSAVAAA